MIWIVVGVALAAGAVVLVALPFLREPGAVDDRLDAPTDAQERRLLLVEERDRALAALKELEFDHRTGKIADDDYGELVGPLRQEAARTLRALDEERRAGPSAHEPKVRQVAVPAVEGEAVADEELVGDGETDVADRQVVDEPPIGPLEEGRDVQRRGVAEAK